MGCNGVNGTAVRSNPSGFPDIGNKIKDNSDEVRVVAEGGG